MATRCGWLPCLRQTRGGRSGRAPTHSSYTTTWDVTLAAAAHAGLNDREAARTIHSAARARGVQP